MKDEQQYESFKSEPQMSLFRFELNHSQTSLFLILSLLGLFMIPFNIASDIFLGLFDFLFMIIPDYLEDPGIRPEGYLFYYISQLITSLVLSIIFLTLIIYSFRRILKYKSDKKIPNKKLIKQERIVNWFGLKLSHGHAIFIFSVSILGIFFILGFLIERCLLLSLPDLLPFFSFHGLFESLCIIPDGPNQGVGHILLDKNVPIAIMITFLVICLYTLFISRRGKKFSSSKKITSIHGLLIFICSFFVLILYSARIFCHLALFNYDIAYLLRIPYNSINSYQNTDFIKSVVIFCICLVLMFLSFFLKERNKKKEKSLDEVSWIGIKLNPIRATVILSSALIYIIILTLTYLSYLFLFGNFIFMNFSNIFFHFILIPIILFSYYPIAKILRRNYFEKSLEKIDNFNDLKTNWFKFHLNRKNSAVLFASSCGIIVLFLYQLATLNMLAQSLFLYFDPRYTYMFFSFPFMVIFTFLIIAVNVYTIKKTLPSIRGIKKRNLEIYDDSNNRD